MDDLLDLYRKYDEGKYSIADVSRILSYIAIPGVSEEDVEQVEDQIESIRFLTAENEQKEKVKYLLDQLIEKNNSEDI